MRALTVPAVFATLALAAGCGSSSSSGETKTSSAATTSASAAVTVPLATTTISSLHKTVITDGAGRTIYVLSPETTTHLLCTSSACLGAWPPVTVSSASQLTHAFPGISGRLGTVKRPDGTLQLTVDGHPVYAYAGDSGPGQAVGEELQSYGGTWLVLSPTGTVIHASAGGSSSGGAGAY